jgi:hypothetical protein
MELAPRILASTFHNFSGSSDIPTEYIANVFERLVLHPPHALQELQLMLFLDVQVRPRWGAVNVSGTCMSRVTLYTYMY